MKPRVNPRLKAAYHDHQRATRLSLGTLGFYVLTAAFFGLTIGTAALGAVYPDLTAVIADPIVCDGHLQRTSERFAYDRPGHTTITHEFFCHESDGRVTTITGKTFGAAALMWTLGIFVLLFVRRALVVLGNRLLVAGNAFAAKALIHGAMGLCGAATGLLAWRELSVGLSDGSPTPYRGVIGILAAWLSLLFWRMLSRRTFTERASAPPWMGIRGVLNLPFALAAAFGPAFAGFWYGLMAQEVNDVASIIFGGIAALFGVLPALLALRFALNPKAYAKSLEDAAASRQRHRKVMATFGETGDWPDQAEAPEQEVLERLSRAHRRRSSSRGRQPAPVAGTGMGQQLAEIAQAQKLHESGALTDEEFAAVKRRILGRQ